MANHLIVKCCFFIALLGSSLAAFPATELDAYVRVVDPVYGWTSTGTNFTTAQYSAYFYTLTSLQYLDANLTDRSVWKHTVVYIVPTNLNASCTDAFIWLTWGSNKADGPKPWKANTEDDIDLAVISQVAIGTGCPAIAVYQIPNQEICFYDNASSTFCDSEDSAIAYTFNRYLYQNRSAEFLLLFPMAKAGIRAMDAVQEFASKDFGHTIKEFIVSGASKRGWTTWLVGAVDYKNRVKAIVPVVLDALNFGHFIHRQWKSYEGFTFVLHPYWKWGLTTATALPRFATWSTEIDPFSYRDRLTMPKFSVNAVGDEFQLLDDQAHWAHEMKGEMKTILIKDADHLLITNFGLAIRAVVAFTQSVVHNIVRPSYTWSIDNVTGQITLTTSTPPKKVELVQTTVNNGMRDFRDTVLNEDPCVIKVMGGCVRFILWETSAASATGPTTFTTDVAAPSAGYTGFYLQVEFASENGLQDYVFATPASVLPLKFPFEDCAGAACYGKMV